MMRCGAAAVRHRHLTLAIWVALTLVLAIQGLSFGERITPSSLDVPGTSSAQAQAVAARYFGTEASLPVLLEGPRAELDRQGPALVDALRTKREFRVLSPWDGGRLVPELRPRKTAALVLVVAQTDNTFASGIGNDVRGVVRNRVRAPVRASVSGFSVVGGDLKDASLSAAHDAERLAIPLLVLVLLLVFRSPIAALVPAVFGIAAVESGYGAVGLFGELHPISDVATALTSMMGLALGVDYSLLLVSRFREELAGGLSPVDAAIAAQRSAGRTVLFAGVTLVVAMLAAIALSPGDFLFSAAASVATVAIVSMAGSFLAAPALLAMLGTNLDRWRIGGVPREGGRWAALAEAVQRRPFLWGGLALVPLVALSLPALGLDTGPPDVRALPKSSVARADAQRVTSTLGEGWTAPFEVYVADPSGPITTDARLKALARWQSRIARWPEVATVIGPGAIATQQPGLLRADRMVASTERRMTRSRQDARKLSAGLRRASGGVGDLRTGLAEARDAANRLGRGASQGESGAVQLTSALRRARTGASELAAGIKQAEDGAGRIDDALGQAASGAGELADGLTQAYGGSGQLTDGATRLASGLRAGDESLGRITSAATEAQARAQALTAALSGMTAGRTDPRYASAVQAANRLSRFVGAGVAAADATDPEIDAASPSLPTALSQARTQLGQAADAADALRDGAAQLQTGLERLNGGAAELQRALVKLHSATSALHAGLQRISSNTSDLPAGLGQLADGAARLSRGLAQLEDGNQQLAGGLGSGAARTVELREGLDRASQETRDAASTNPQRQLTSLQRRSPRLLDSGYFVLAALDGSTRGSRTQASFAVNLERGGQAARITVIPKSGPNDAETRRLDGRLNAAMGELSAATSAQAVTAGIAAQVTDYQKALGGRLPWLIAALSVVTFLVLVVLLRAIVLPLISVGLNLLTVGASFGVVALCFDGDPPLLGGPGWADILSLLGTFTIIFALSLDYQVFILTRMRESWLRYRELRPAITHAIDRTGRVVTGAAAIMGGVFIAFSTAELTIIKQTGVGLATAVLIDATLVRLILLPAAMSLAGRATFWLPSWLDRLLPDLDLEGPVDPNAAPA